MSYGKSSKIITSASLEPYLLFEISEINKTSYLLIKNTTIDPRSIKENIFPEHAELAIEQVSLLCSHYLRKNSFTNAQVKEIGHMEVMPIGDYLCQNKENSSLEIKVLRGENNFCIFGTSPSNSDFINEYNEGIDEYGGSYSQNIEEYNVYFMPSIHYKKISDVDKVFSQCTKYDYTHSKWIPSEKA